MHESPVPQRASRRDGRRRPSGPGWSSAATTRRRSPAPPSTLTMRAPVFEPRCEPDVPAPAGSGSRSVPRTRGGRRLDWSRPHGTERIAAPSRCARARSRSWETWLGSKKATSTFLTAVGASCPWRSSKMMLADARRHRRPSLAARGLGRSRAPARTSRWRTRITRSSSSRVTRQDGRARTRRSSRLGAAQAATSCRPRRCQACRSRASLRARRTALRRHA